MHASAAVLAFVAVAAAAQTPVAPVATPVATPGAPTNGTKPGSGSGSGSGSTPANGAAALGLSGLAGALAVALAL
ncbi:hypothetical protein H9Q72_012420 [Fusarium xylarioides]|uniref:Uncharacterized protein n=2 Tax=Fusarium fujikuroi species complex TaxID=171627 RepID=A0A9P7L0J1_9HYPO|nr:hypothetical protein FPHYL_3516 [Fusarium phyllophilum]KAG5759459.1 hypothetical protein H9Q72_012420 [Fusarium xylarioides]